MNEKSCIKCGEDVQVGDRFCRHCGEADPASGISWDWKECPPFGKFNALLRPFGVEIIEMETNTDQHAVKVRAIPKN